MPGVNPNCQAEASGENPVACQFPDGTLRTEGSLFEGPTSIWNPAEAGWNEEGYRADMLISRVCLTVYTCECKFVDGNSWRCKNGDNPRTFLLNEYAVIPLPCIRADDPGDPPL